MRRSGFSASAELLVFLLLLAGFHCGVTSIGSSSTKASLTSNDTEDVSSTAECKDEFVEGNGEARKAGIASKDPSHPQAAVLDWHRCLQPLVSEFVILQTADFK